MRKLGVLALVIVGLLAIVQGIAFLGSSLWLLPDLLYSDTGLISIALAATLVVLPVAFGAMILWRREALAQRLFAESEEPLVVDSNAMLRVALVVMGLWLLLESATGVLSAVTNWISLARQESAIGMDYSFGFSDKLQLLSRGFMDVVELTVGLLFILRSDALAARLLRAGPAAPVRPVPVKSSCPECGQPFDLSDYRDESSARCAQCGAPLSGGA